jgi:hypothetical protein
MEPRQHEGWRQSLIDTCDAEGPKAASNEQTRAYNALAHMAKNHVALTKVFAIDCLLQIRQDRAGAASTVQNIASRHGWNP